MLPGIGMVCIVPAACGMLIFQFEVGLLKVSSSKHLSLGPQAKGSTLPVLPKPHLCRGIQLAPSDTRQVWPKSDKFSKGKNHVSVTSMTTLLPGREPVSQRSEKSQCRVKPKRRVFWCVLSLTPLMMDGAEVQSISNRLP